MHAGMILAEAGWDVTFLTAPSVSSKLELPNHHAIREFRTSERKDFTVSPFDYFEYCFKSIGLAIQLKPDVIYVSDALGTLHGLLARLFCKSVVVYHEHDSPNQHGDLHPLIRWARADMLDRADLVIFSNAERARHVRTEIPFNLNKLKIVWDLPRPNEVAREALQSADERPFTLYYHGSITPDRIPLTLVETLKRFEGQVRLVIAGYESGSSIGFVQKLIESVACTAAQDCIHYLGQVQRESLFRVAQAADLGLALMPMDSEDVNMAHMAGASNKAFEYMAVGLLPLVSSLPEWIEMFVEPNFAVAADPGSVDSLYNVIQSVRTDLAEHRAANAARRAKIQSELNYDREFQEAVLPSLRRNT